MGPMQELFGRSIAGQRAESFGHSAGSIEWDASEYVHHDKGAGWVIVLAAVALVGIAAAAWFGQWTFAFLLAVMAMAFGYYAVRKPQTIHYKLDHEGLAIGQKSFPMSSFRSFGVLEDGPLFTIRLIPAKRFSPAIMIYFAKDDGEKIVDIFGSHIPMEQMQLDLMDMLMRKLRF